MESYSLKSILYLVVGCLTTPPHRDYDLVGPSNIYLDPSPPLEKVAKYSRTTKEIVLGDGYVCDEHHVATEDGYVLEMLRVAKHDIAHNATALPVLLNHGLLCYSGMWVWAGREMSLPYMLADLGMDVWLGTFRGGRGSDTHTSLDKNSDEYWQFSYDHIAMYDVPTMINYVLFITNSSSINYIGHSMGGSTYFAMCNYKPNICKYKVNLMVGLAAHSDIHHTISPAPRLLVKKYQKFDGRHWSQKIFGRLLDKNIYELGGGKQFQKLLGKLLRHISEKQSRHWFQEKFGRLLVRKYEIIGRHWVQKIFGRREFKPPPEIMREMAATFCTKSMNSAGLCRMGFFVLVGPSNLNMTKDTLGYVSQGFPTTTSVMLMEHYVQFVAHKQWAKFDYGKAKNLLMYNSVFPPLYSLQNVTTPVALFSSDWDLMVTPMDTKTLSLGLPNLIYEKKMRPFYNHGDFFLNADNSDLFKEVVEIIK